MNLREKLKNRHHDMSEAARLFYYGTLGNGFLAILDTAAHQHGGEGAVVNGVHNVSDVCAYGIRAAIAGKRLPAINPEKVLGAVNILAISATALVCVRSGMSIIDPRGSAHAADLSATFLSSGSSGGNFIIANRLEPENESINGCAHHTKNPEELAHQDGHHHATADAWASMIATSGVALTAATDNYRFDSIGTIVGGCYFIQHMINHMRQRNGDGHAHSDRV